ncbi:MAG: hypothetical protein JXR45_05320, partial [Deltaproteobacteria bacterium]|nr:hypothetical protein [Deltaproteobacteria bacterium]
MKLNRYWLYPQVRNWNRIIPYVLLGGIIGGMYGTIHDQISYTISPEYSGVRCNHRLSGHVVGGGNSNFDDPPKLRRSEARTNDMRFNSDDLATARQDVLHGFGIVFGCAVVAFCVGAILGWF